MTQKFSFVYQTLLFFFAFLFQVSYTSQRQMDDPGLIEGKEVKRQKTCEVFTEI